MSHFYSILETILLPFARLEFVLVLDLAEVAFISFLICSFLLWFWFWLNLNLVHRHFRTEAVQELKVFFHRHRYCCHVHLLLVVRAAVIPAAMSAALSASAGRKSLFVGLSATESAVLISSVSPLRLQPAGLAQSRSCFRQAQSSLSMQGSSNCPPAAA